MLFVSNCFYLNTFVFFWLIYRIIGRKASSNSKLKHQPVQLVFTNSEEKKHQILLHISWFMMSFAERFNSCWNTFLNNVSPTKDLIYSKKAHLKQTGLIFFMQTKGHKKYRATHRSYPSLLRQSHTHPTSWNHQAVIYSFKSRLIKPISICRATVQNAILKYLEQSKNSPFN
jgi:hypothetical protein